MVICAGGKGEKFVVYLHINDGVNDRSLFNIRDKAHKLVTATKCGISIWEGVISICVSGCYKNSENFPRKAAIDGIEAYYRRCLIEIYVFVFYKFMEHLVIIHVVTINYKVLRIWVKRILRIKKWYSILVILIVKIFFKVIGVIGILNHWIINVSIGYLNPATNIFVYIKERI